MVLVCIKCSSYEISKHQQWHVQSKKKDIGKERKRENCTSTRIVHWTNSVYFFFVFKCCPHHWFQRYIQKKILLIRRCSIYFFQRRMERRKKRERKKKFKKYFLPLSMDSSVHYKINICAMCMSFFSSMMCLFSYYNSRWFFLSFSFFVSIE